MRVNSSQTTRVTLHTHERFPAFGKRKRNEEKGEHFFFVLHFQQFFLSLVFVICIGIKDSPNTVLDTGYLFYRRIYDNTDDEYERTFCSNYHHRCFVVVVVVVVVVKSNTPAQTC